MSGWEPYHCGWTFCDVSKEKVSAVATETSMQFHFARPVAPIGQGWMEISPTGVQSHWSFRDVTGGQEVVIDGAFRELSETFESVMSNEGEETNDLPEKVKKWFLIPVVGWIKLTRFLFVWNPEKWCSLIFKTEGERVKPLWIFYGLFTQDTEPFITALLPCLTVDMWKKTGCIFLLKNLLYKMKCNKEKSFFCFFFFFLAEKGVRQKWFMTELHFAGKK